MEVSWVRNIDAACPTCGSVDIEFEYHHLYMMGDPKPTAREGTCTCKKCGHRFPHTQWRPAPSKEEILQKKIGDEILEACKPFILAKNTMESRHEMAAAIQLVVDKYVLLRVLKERMSAEVLGIGDTLYVTLNKLPVYTALKEAMSRLPSPKAPAVEPAKPEPPKDDEDPFWTRSAGKKIGLPMTVSFNMDERDELEKLLGVHCPEDLIVKIRQMVHEYDSKAGLNALVASKMGAVDTRRRMAQLLKEEPDLFQLYTNIVANVLLDELRSPSIKIQAHRDRVAAKILNKLFNLE